MCNHQGSWCFPAPETCRLHGVVVTPLLAGVWCCHETNNCNGKHRILFFSTWWRHQMEAFTALLALCAGNSPVTGEFPAQRPVTQSFDVFFDLGWVINREAGDLLSRSLWLNSNETFQMGQNHTCCFVCELPVLYSESTNAMERCHQQTQINVNQHWVTVGSTRPLSDWCYRKRADTNEGRLQSVINERR